MQPESIWQFLANAKKLWNIQKDKEKNLKETIKKKKVSWEEYKIPEELTKKGDVEDKIKKFADGK